MNYYKITNQDENHNSLQYRTGLVEDILPFNPSGSCEPGGIYFASKDILAFLYYGPWIRKVTLPEGETVYEDPDSSPKKYKAHKVTLGRRRKITPKVIKGLINEGANVHIWNNCAIHYASENGYVEVVKVLLEAGADVHACDDYALLLASENGHVEVVKILIKAGADVHALDDCAIRNASRNGHVKVVKVLIKAGADVHADNDDAFRVASRYGHVEVVKVLLKMGADVHACNDYAIRFASKYGHVEVVKVLKEHIAKEV